MFKKKYAFLVLLSLLICMLAISSASAADDAINEDLSANEVTVDEVVADDSISDNVLESENEDIIVNDVVEDTSEETLAVEEEVVAPQEVADVTEEEVVTPQEAVDVTGEEVDISDETLAIENKVSADKNVLSSSENEEIISQSNTEEVLGSPTYDVYSVTVNDLTIQKGKPIAIPIHIEPNTGSSYAYDFYLRIYDSDGDQILSTNIYSYDAVTSYVYNYTYELAVGTYSIQIVNYEDGVEMDSAILKIVTPPTQNVTISISQKGNYYKNKNLTIKVKDKKTGAVVKNCNVTLKFSNGKSAKVKTNSKGIATYKVPYDAGTYKVQAVATSAYVKGQSAKVTVKILKHNVRLTLSQSGRFYQDKKITVRAYDTSSRTPIKGKYLKIRFSNGKTVKVKTNSKGIATYKVNFKPGRYSAVASWSLKNYKVPSKRLNNIRILKIPVKIIVRTLRTPYDSGRTINIKVVNRATNKPVKGVKLAVKVQGKRRVIDTTACDGKLSLDYSNSSLGRHKVIVKVASRNLHSGSSRISYLIINKGKMSVYAPESVNVYRRNDNYTLWVYNNYSYRPVKNAKVIFKVYTGRKYKTFTAKTDEYGLASFNSRSLSRGRHKIVISVRPNRYYKATRGVSLVNVTTKIPTVIGYKDKHYYYSYYSVPTTIPTYYYGYTTYTTYYTTYSYISSIGVDVVLYDKFGNPLSKTVRVTHSSGDYKSGISGGDTISVSGSGSGTITLDFDGDGRYLPSSYTFDL